MKNRKQKNKERDLIAKSKIQHKKIFMANLKKVCNLFAGYDLFSKFPSSYVEKMYRGRYYGLKVVGTKKDGVKSEDIGLFRVIIYSFITENSIALNDNKGEVSVGLQLVEGLTLMLHTCSTAQMDFPEEKEIRDVLKNYRDDSDYHTRFIASISQLLFHIGMFVGDFESGLIWGKYSYKVSERTGAINNTISFYGIELSKSNFTIGNSSRPALRVGWAYPFEGMRWASIKPSQLDKDYTGDDLPMEVYVQHHALKRLEERIGLSTGVMHCCIHVSINSNLQYHIDEKGRILIHYYFLEKKAGYLVSSIQDGKIFIHTFLFLTNNGTPEGKKLSQLTGLQLMDKKYLAIDKLSTFLSYNIEDNDYVKNIFIESGCRSLLEMVEFKSLSLTDAKALNVELIRKYLMANKDAVTVQ